jgi:selenide,water dikinase
MLEGFGALFPPELTRDVLVGLEAPDDAAVYRLDEGRALIFTADYFPPVVDSPRAYGAIAATNALNDVFAMGGIPALALNLATFPDDMPPEVAREILWGGAEKAREAGAVIAGGHTTRGEEPTYGLAVIGFADPAHLTRKGGARPGDRLLLTKPLGSGVVTTAGKAGAAPPEVLRAAIDSMARLNAAAAAAARATGARTGTDVTGFGLVGHALEVAAASGVAIRVRCGAVPLLPGAAEAGRAGHFPGGAARNEEHFGARVRSAAGLDPVLRRLMFSPETAGGLLVAVPEARAADFVATCRAGGQPAWEIGEVLPGAGLELAP